MQGINSSLTEQPVEGAREMLTAGVAAEGLTDIELYANALQLVKVVRAAVFYLFYFIRRSAEPPEEKVA